MPPLIMMEKETKVVEVPADLPTDLPYPQLVHNKVEVTVQKDKPHVFLLDSIIQQA